MIDETQKNNWLKPCDELIDVAYPEYKGSLKLFIRGWFKVALKEELEELREEIALHKSRYTDHMSSKRAFDEGNGRNQAIDEITNMINNKINNLKGE